MCEFIPVSVVTSVLSVSEDRCKSWRDRTSSGELWTGLEVAAAVPRDVRWLQLQISTQSWDRPAK